MPRIPMEPVRGLRPATPHRAAGRRTDPPVSVPTPSNAAPVATAAADPPLDPPAMRPRSTGLRVGGVVTPFANSCVLTFPMTIAPALRKWETISASLSATRRSGTLEPADVGIPPTSTISLTATHTPSNGPLRKPSFLLRSSSDAFSRAPSASRWTKALTSLSVAETRARQRCTASTQVSRPT